MYKVTTSLVVSLLLFVGISLAMADKFEVKFESTDDLNNFKVIDDGTRDEKGDWRIFPVGTTPEKSPDGRISEVGVLNQLTDNVKDGNGPSGNDPAAGGYLLLTAPGSTGWSNYTVSADFVYTDDDWWGIMFYYTDELNYYRYRVSQRDSVENNQNPEYKLEKFVKGAYTELATGEIDGARIPDAEPGKDNKIEPHNFKVSVSSGNIELFFDDTSVDVVSDSDLTEGSIAFFMTTNTGWIDNLVVEGPDIVAVEPAGKLTTTWAGIKANF